MQAVSAAIALLVVTIFGCGVTAQGATEALIYTNPQCSCCEAYADHLRGHGFKVTVRETNQLVPMSRKAGISADFEGCHLAHIDGYVVSGHVPASTIKRLLKERPDIKGITLPGMPLGSPGMSGAKEGPFIVYEIGAEPAKVYAKE